mgnify:CR=1 FL=1
MKNPKILPVSLALVLGIAIMAMVTLVQHAPAPPEGEYHWSKLLQNNFGWLAVLLQVAAGFALGYYFRLNAFVTGLCLIAIFPITSTVEATVHRGSHNLIPVEIAMHLAYALPAAIAAFAGGRLAGKKQA